MLSFCSSLACGCCPAWAAGRLPGAGHGVRGGKGGLRGLFSSSLHRGCCPERAAGRLPGAGHGVRGVPPLHPLHPRTPRLAVTWKLSLESGCTLSAACRMGHRREPSPACGRGDVRACFGAPSALRASGIAFAPAPSLHQGEGGESGPAGSLSQRGNNGRTPAEWQWRREIDGAIVPGGGQEKSRAACGSFEIRVKIEADKNTIKSRCLPHVRGGRGLVSSHRKMPSLVSEERHLCWGGA